MKTIVRCLTLLSLILLPVKTFAAGPDVEFYGVIKAQYFLQDNSLVAALNDHRHDGNGMDEGPLAFQVFVELTASNVVQNASITNPLGVATNLFLSSDGKTKHLEVTFDSKAELDTKYPNGIYSLRMEGDNDGPRVVNLTLPEDTYPSVPRISNYSEAQAVNGSSFPLTWDAFTGGTTGDYVEVRVKEETMNGSTNIYGSPDFGTAGALNGTSTSVLVTNLSPGKVYTATLMFARATVNTDGYGIPGVTGVVGYTKETEFTIRTTGTPTPADTTPPDYLGSTPRDGSTNVARHSVIAFHFDEPMQPGYSIDWDPSVTANNFTYTWSADAMTLFCKYSTDLPANTQISWTLNPDGPAKNFRNLADIPLSSFGGQFTTGSQTPPGVDVEGIFLIKGRGAFTTNGPPVDSGMFQFGLESELTGHNTVTNGTLSIPGGGMLNLHPDDQDGDDVKLKVEYASQADMDRFFPNGDYTVSLNTARNGTKNVNISLTDNAYPSFPTIANFSSTQSVNPSNNFVLSWSGFTTGTASDIIEVEIRNQYDQEVYYSPDPGEPGSLDGTATQVTIPANTLAPGRTYEATVRFIKIKHFEESASGYAGVMAVSVYASETEFKLSTAGQVIRPRFSVLPMNDGSFRARVTGEKGIRYTIEATQDFVNWYYVTDEEAWSNINGLEATIDFTDGNSWNLPHRFYRAKEGSSDNNQGSGSFVSLEGTVRNANNPSVLVQGAIVFTSLDGQSTITDSSGHFFLQTTTPANYSTTPYTVTVSASGYQTFIGNANWGDHPTGLFIDLTPSP